MLEASIVVIGDEILGGFVQDTNSGWLASRLQSHGVDLSRIVTVPDDIGAIGGALGAELARSRPRIVFTSGGIGSTPDDLTYEAIADHLGRPLVEVPEIARFIDVALRWTEEHGVDVDEEFADHMLRMARAPEGARLLRPGGGFAPGVRVDVDGGLDDPEGATIVVLPGVPGQLRAIVTEHVEPELLAGRGRDETVVEVAHGYPESVLNRVFVRIGERCPHVKVGSYPGVPMLVRLRGPATAVDEANALLTAELERLQTSGSRIRAAWAQRAGGGS